MGAGRKSSNSGSTSIELDSAITRRDFVGTTLIGAGAGLLAMHAPGLRAAPSAAGIVPPTGFGPDWTGPGGLGDYRRANGNTHEVVNAGHALARGGFSALPANTVDTGETYDMVMVGGGFAGLSAGLTAMWGGKRCLILDNHAMFGGEGRYNLFDVDGVKLYAPQGSNEFSLPTQSARDMDFVDPYWEKVGLPVDFMFADLPERLRGRIRFSRDNFGPQIHQQGHATQGHFYFNSNRDGGTWAMHPWDNGFRDAPVADSEKQEIMRFTRDLAVPAQAPKAGWEAWLDTMSYRDYIEQVKGYSPRMTAYMDNVVAAGYTGCACEHLSAYGAYTFAYPGTLGFYGDTAATMLDGFEFGSFPGGNSGINRYFVKTLIPDAIAGAHEYSDIHNGAVNLAALDRPSNQVRIRLDALVVHVKHDGDSERAQSVTVGYLKDGRVHLVKARTVVMCGHGHIAKHICADLPREIRAAYDELVHGPMLTVNVALRHWRFLEKLGVSAVRWFGGEMGFWLNVRQPMIMSDGSTMPFDPDLPVALSVYIPFPTAGVDGKTSGAMGRARLFAMSYADIESWVVRHFTLLFGSHGFDAKRDIAGVITNRWGHAYVSPPPGFFFDRSGHRAPMNVLQGGYGRIFFGHSETAGRQLWSVATAEGRRAANQALALL